MRLAVYLDYVHRREGARVYAPRAFALFVAGLRPAFDRLVVAGRVDPEPGTSHYPVAEDVEFAEMPHYSSAANPVEIARILGRALRDWNGVLRRVDGVWVLGPQGLPLPFSPLAPPPPHGGGLARCLCAPPPPPAASAWCSACGRTSPRTPAAGIPGGASCTSPRTSSTAP